MALSTGARASSTAATTGLEAPVAYATGPRVSSTKMVTGPGMPMQVAALLAASSLAAAADLDPTTAAQIEGKTVVDPSDRNAEGLVRDIDGTPGRLLRSFPVIFRIETGEPASLPPPDAGLGALEPACLAAAGLACPGAHDLHVLVDEHAPAYASPRRVDVVCSRMT